jgi:hypothetical protein
VEKFIFKIGCIYSVDGVFVLSLASRKEAEAGSAAVQPARNTSG